MTSPLSQSSLPIGVFDSGVGGLTVLRALRRELPGESFVYLGDTARLPYGTKSAGTIARYAVQCSRALVERGIKLLVVACNTASAVAIDELRAQWPGMPVIGVVEPGAQAAVAASRSRRIAVIGTESTIRGGAYTRAIAALAPDATVLGRACPLFVALAEEGWTDGPIAESIAREYLASLAQDCDVLVLGCTHFPLLAAAIARVVGPEITIVDSAATTAAAVRERLGTVGMLDRGASSSPACVMLATDGRERFARVGAGFLGLPLAPGDVEIVDL